jgi:hypothetical protein
LLPLNSTFSPDGKRTAIPFYLLSLGGRERTTISFYLLSPGGERGLPFLFISSPLGERTKVRGFV